MSAPKQAESLLTAIAGNLGIDTAMVSEAYEDPAEWLLKEGKLPDNVDPSNSKLDDPEARTRMAKVFERGLTKPTGYVLPVQRWNARRRIRAGARRNGRRGAASCSWCPATRRSAIACR